MKLIWKIILKNPNYGNALESLSKLRNRMIFPHKTDFVTIEFPNASFSWTLVSNAHQKKKRENNRLSSRSCFFEMFTLELYFRATMGVNVWCLSKRDKLIKNFNDFHRKAACSNGKGLVSCSCKNRGKCENTFISQHPT